MITPGGAGSQRPPGADWQARKLRDLQQENERLRGQLSQALARAAAGVTDVTVVGSTLKVTYGNGTTTTYQLP